MHFGVADYAAFNKARTVVIGGLNPDYPGDQWHFALSRMTVACRAYGLRPIDGPFGGFDDPEGYKAAARQRAAALGIEGKWAIHPSQIELANDVYLADRQGSRTRRAHPRGAQGGRSAGQGRCFARRQDDRRRIREDGEEPARHGSRHQGGRSRTRQIGRARTTSNILGSQNGHPRIPGQRTSFEVRRADPARRPRLQPRAGDLSRQRDRRQQMVVKAQIHSGARGKAGGIKVCRDEREIERSRRGHARQQARDAPDRAVRQARVAPLHRGSDRTSTKRNLSGLRDGPRHRAHHGRRFGGGRHGDRGNLRDPARHHHPRHGRPRRRHAAVPGARGRLRLGVDPEIVNKLVPAIIGMLPRVPRSRRDHGGDQPARHHQGKAGLRARRQDVVRRERAVPPPAHRRAPRQEPGRPARDLRFRSRPRPTSASMATSAAS